LTNGNILLGRCWIQPQANRQTNDGSDEVDNGWRFGIRHELSSGFSGKDLDILFSTIARRLVA
jgi:hypothetical protein